MFLKRIILNGFKSFADRTEFEFGSGITTIVGPNGCGKSNVLDAVRWVLGEQSARSLRGSKMADVIFAGSRSRKPANAAEVRLVFDNRHGVLRSDDQEVTVGRVLYRSGDSEYLLNGKTCRLKDIRELLMDTGVGVDAYSVIEQGRVDLLLQASPVERREIFEEAAGISRYKVRRVEAQRKLERTQHNLLRLQDIIEELERRLRSVRLAAGKARNFQQYDARLRELRSSYSLSEYHELEQGRQRVGNEVAALEGQLQQYRTQVAAHDAELAEHEHTRQALDDQIQEKEAELVELQSRLSTLEERIAQGEKRLPELAATRSRREQQAEDIAGRLAALEERIQREEAALAELQRAEAAAAARIDALTASRRAAESEAQEARQALEQEKVAAFEAVRRASLLQNEQENLAQQHQRLSAQIERLSTREQELQGRQRDVAEQVAAAEERVASLDRQLGGLQQELHADDEQLAALHQEAEALDEQIGADKEARSGLTSRLGLLADMERRLEGVDQGTQTVLGWRGLPEHAETGIVGLVADLLRIDDPRVGALAAVLSAFESHVVVRDAGRLAGALEQYGELPGPLRALALDRLGTAVRSPVSYAHAPGYVGRGADWVECAPEYRDLAERLLGRTYVVETLDHALSLAAEAVSGCIFVTLDGECVGADGRMSFGHAATQTGLISRKAEIRQLQAELDEVEGRLVQRTRRRLQVEESVSDVQLRRDGLLDRIATLQREHADARNEHGRLHEEGQRVERERGTLRDELAQVRQAADEISSSLADRQAESESVVAARQQHEARIEKLATEARSQDEAAARLSQQCTAALVERGRAVEKREGGEEALEDLRTRLEALIQERSDAQAEAADAARQIELAEGELKQSREAHAAGQAKCAAQREAVVALREERQGLRQKLEACGVAGRALQRQLDDVEERLHERQVVRRETEVRTEALVARVRDELDIDLAEKYAEYEHAEQDWEAVRAEIEELRGKIARLGHVNLDAITELEELTPRYENMIEQRDDLSRAIERLESLIVELDNESRTRFASAFEDIRGNFQEMFRKLFGGGKADIILEDPENPLECGIEIIARPPGKEPRSISLLSGGEKTLTAVALLMGVFKSRPSPFAILDEVDAALDESNVGRFNTVLQEFLSHTQFVVITHSKKTMACADVLYGVTMEEPGVSKRVSVRFDDRVQAPSVA